MKRLILIVLLMRFATNMAGFFIANDALYGQVYTFGVLCLEIYLLWSVMPLYKEDELCRNFIDFSIGAAVYSLIKLLLLDPYEVNMWEYFSCIAGFIYIALKYVYNRVYKRTA